MKKASKQTEMVPIKNLLLTMVLLTILLIGSAINWRNVTVAEDAADPPPLEIEVPKQDKAAAEAITSAACESELTKFGDAEFDKYKSFMEDNFKNKSTTASLMDLAIKRYDEFKETIRSKYQILIGQQLELAASNETSLGASATGLARCSKLANDYIDNASKMLQMRAVTTSNIKKASTFVEKYKQINEKLRGLNLEVMRMVTNVSSFEKKLPCYLKACV